jgi:riboflavin biosynthesis pyrimidine reductase
VLHTDRATVVKSVLPCLSILRSVRLARSPRSTPRLRGHPSATATIVKDGGTSYVLVTEGIDAALLHARRAAGSDDVLVNGGADIARQYLAASAIDELRLHLVPTILGAGTRPFDERLSPNSCCARARRTRLGWLLTSLTRSSGRRLSEAKRLAAVSRW